MKRILTIPLAFLYLLVSSGLILEVHHCMGRVADAELHLFAQDDTHCGNCGMEKKTEGKHCCKDEYRQIKVSEDQKLPVLTFLFQALAPEAILPVSGFQLPAPVAEQVVAYQVLPNPPPKLPDDVQAFLSVYRI